MKKLFIPLLFAALAVGCGGDMPTDTDVPSADFAVAGNSGCATVQFNWSTVPTSGPVTGDLEGTVSYTFIGGTKFAGATQKNGGTAHWDITGGVLGPMTFETEFDNMNIAIDRPGSPGTLFENIGKHRATSGVTKANLHYAGTFSLLTFMLDHDFQGVICP
jgi:hypothetical protein